MRTIRLMAILVVCVAAVALLTKRPDKPLPSSPPTLSASYDAVPVSVPSAAPNDPAWGNQVRAAGRSWQEGYCRWAWEHGVAMFPNAQMPNDEIATGDLKSVEIDYAVGGQQRHGRCTFTPEGRALPEFGSDTIRSPKASDVSENTATEPDSASLRMYEEGSRGTIEAEGALTADMQCKSDRFQQNQAKRNYLIDALDRDPKMMSAKEIMTDEDFRRFKIYERQIREKARANEISDLGCDLKSLNEKPQVTVINIARP